MLACEIILLPSLTPGGKHLLIATNRDSPNPKGDAIALFSVSDEDGSKVERVADQPWIEGVGNHVRGMAADQSGKWVIMAGRDGGGVKMFERVGKEGLNLQEVAHVDLEKVVCPLWIE
jgi:6-phosphogluconolactonase